MFEQMESSAALKMAQKSFTATLKINVVQILHWVKASLALVSHAV
jgi:hypothetical protein